ncbi:MAG: norM 2 [Massilibacillus sp.]|jgi:putative MATE family efflux protein|nr:norM 2 [Massilibacillus sp.]
MQSDIGHNKQSIIKMSWPIFIEVFLQMLVGNVDQFMISQYSQPSVAAVGNGNQIMNIIIILLTVMSTATTILIAQYLGAKNQEKISEVCTVSLLFNGLFGLVSSVLLITFHRQLFAWLQVPAEIMDETSIFFSIIASGIVVQGLYFSFVASFRGYSWMKTTMVVSSVMNILNIFGNWLLIYGFWNIPAMGVAGVAISTTISKCIGLVIIYYIFKKYLGVKISLKYLRPFPWDSLKRILYIGIPSGGETLSYQLSQTTIMKMVNAFGLIVINTKVYVAIVAMFAYIYALAISAAMQIVVGYLIGSNKFDEVGTKVWYTMRISLFVCTGLTVLLYLSSDYVLGIFTTDPEVLKLGKTILFIEIFLEIGRAINIVMVRALQAAGDIKTPVTVGIVCMWSIAVGLSYVLGIVMEMGLVGIWIAMATDECVRAVIFIYRWRSGAWKKRKLIEV